MSYFKIRSRDSTVVGRSHTVSEPHAGENPSELVDMANWRRVDIRFGLEAAIGFADIVLEGECHKLDWHAFSGCVVDLSEATQTRIQDRQVYHTLSYRADIRRMTDERLPSANAIALGPKVFRRAHLHALPVAGPDGLRRRSYDGSIIPPATSNTSLPWMPAPQPLNFYIMRCARSAD